MKNKNLMMKLGAIAVIMMVSVLFVACGGSSAAKYEGKGIVGLSTYTMTINVDKATGTGSIKGSGTGYSKVSFDYKVTGEDVKTVEITKYKDETLAILYADIGTKFTINADGDLVGAGLYSTVKLAKK